MRILELIQLDWSYFLSVAIFHSLWQSVIVFLILIGFKKFKFMQSAERMYFLHIAGLAALLFCFIYNAAFAVFENGNVIEFGLYNSELFVDSINTFIGVNTGYYITLHQIISMFWLSGVLIFIAKFLLSNAYLGSIRNNSVKISGEFDEQLTRVSRSLGMRKAVQILHSDRISIPFTMGYIKPIIIFPFSYINHLSPAQFESILIHELVHIKRHDFLINQIQSFIECILFFNPFCWYMSGQIRKYREYYCDDEVQYNIDNKKEYLKALYKVARFSGLKKANVIALYNNKSELVMRIKRMMNQSNEKKYHSPIVTLAIFIFLVFGLFSFNKVEEKVFENDIHSQISELLNKTYELPQLEKDLAQFQVDKVATNELLEARQSNVSKKDDQFTPQRKKVEVVNEKVELAMIELLDMQNIAMYESTRLIEESDIKRISQKIKAKILGDTIPESDKVQKLEKRLEEKSLEIEELARKIEFEISDKVKAHAQRIEELSMELDLRISDQVKEIESRMEENVDNQKIEKLSRELEQRIMERTKDIELLEKENLEPIQQEIERISKEMEGLRDKDGNIKDKDRMRQLEKEIAAKSKEIQSSMMQIGQGHKELMNDPEIKQLTDQIKAAAKEMGEVQINADRLQDSEVKKIQAEIQSLQAQLEEDLKPIQTELKEMIQAKAKEMEQIARELELERAKGH